jgi:hypothetical protein
MTYRQKKRPCLPMVSQGTDIRSFQSSGKLLVYSSNRRNGRDIDVYVMDPISPGSTRLLANLDGEDCAVFDWSVEEPNSA